MNPHEPHQDPDWEGIFARLDGAPTPDEIAEAKRQGAEAMLDALAAILPKTPKAWAGAAKAGLARSVGIRLLTLLHIRRHPAMHHVCSNDHLAALLKCSRAGIKRTTALVVEQSGLKRGAIKGHKWSKKADV